MKMEFYCHYDVHFSRFFVLHRYICTSVLISVSWGSLLRLLGESTSSSVLALRVLRGGSSVPVLICSWQFDSSFFGSASSRRRQLCPRSDLQPEDEELPDKTPGGGDCAGRPTTASVRGGGGRSETAEAAKNRRKKAAKRAKWDAEHK